MIVFHIVLGAKINHRKEKVAYSASFLTLEQEKAPTLTNRGSNSSMMNYFYFFYSRLQLEKV